MSYTNRWSTPLIKLTLCLPLSLSLSPVLSMLLVLFWLSLQQYVASAPWDKPTVQTYWPLRKKTRERESLYHHLQPATQQDKTANIHTETTISTP